MKVAADLFLTWSPSQPAVATTFFLLWLRWHSNHHQQRYSLTQMFSKPSITTTNTNTDTTTNTRSITGTTGLGSIYGTPQNGSVYLGRYKIEKTIGKGSYGKVKLAFDQREDRYVALKFIARSSIKKSAHWTRIKREMNLLRVLDHPNVIRLHEVHETASDFVLAMEYVRGQDLFDHIVAKSRLEEGEAKVIFAQLLSALEYLHTHRVVHRDLKPENVMVDANLNVKLIDFGFATLFDPKGELATNCGSPLYAAPEIVKGVKYIGPEVDAWSVGVVLYGMVTGCLPFEDDNLKGLYGKICAGEYSVPEHVSPDAITLIKSLICVDSRKRFTVKLALRHKWLSSALVNEMTRSSPSSSSSVGIRYDTLDESLVMQLQRDYCLSEARRQVHDEPNSPGRAIYDLLFAMKHKLNNHPNCNQQKVGRREHVNESAWTVLIHEEDEQVREREVECEYASLTAQDIPKRHAVLYMEEDPSINNNNNFVMQAAASVMNKFRRLREYAR